MVILKKIVIMTEYGKSGCSGIVKFENFAGRTSCFVRILGMSGKGVICIKCGDDVMYCSDIFEGEYHFNALYDLNKTIQIVALKEGSIVCLGSNRGRFSPTAIMTDIHRYFANMPSATVESDQEIQMAQSEFSDESFKDLADNNANIIPVEEKPDLDNVAETQSVCEQIEEIAAEETIQEVKAEPKKVGRTKKSEPFYKKIESNMQELFDKNQKDEELTLLMPGSKWARVPIEGDGYYVVGIIYNDDVPDIICYGVPDKDDSNPPQNSSDCRQWMEIEKGGRGYWMMYQSAQTGETLTMQI